MPTRWIRLLLLVTCCGCAGLALGQAAMIRKLKTELAKERLSDHDRARKLECLSWYLCGADPIAAMEAAQEAMVLAERINDPSLLGSAIVRKVAAKQTASCLHRSMKWCRAWKAQPRHRRRQRVHSSMR